VSDITYQNFALLIEREAGGYRAKANSPSNSRSSSLIGCTPAGRERVNIEPELVEAILDQVKTGEIIGYLGDLKFGNIQVRYVRGYENSKIIRPRQYELWFGAPKRETPTEEKTGPVTQTPPGNAEERGETRSSARLSIFVYDSDTNASIENASVYLKTEGSGSIVQTGVSDPTGVVFLGEVPFGPVVVHVTAKGFRAFGMRFEFRGAPRYIGLKKD
jgi:hypothetical protein